MKSIIFLAMLVIGFASCDTPSTATGNTEMQADSSAMNKTTDSTTTMSKDTTSKMSTDTSTMKKDTIPK